MRVPTTVFCSGRGCLPDHAVPFSTTEKIVVPGKVPETKPLGHQRPCTYEISLVLACFKEKNFNASLCEKEISQYQNCFAKYEALKASLKKKGSDFGTKNVSPKTINSFLTKYPVK